MLLRLPMQDSFAWSNYGFTSHLRPTWSPGPLHCKSHVLTPAGRCHAYTSDDVTIEGTCANNPGAAPIISFRGERYSVLPVQPPALPTAFLRPVAILLPLTSTHLCLHLVSPYQATHVITVFCRWTGTDIMFIKCGCRWCQCLGCPLCKLFLLPCVDFTRY